MFLLLFSIFLLVANCYCFVKKKYLFLFIPCFLFLPDYYGIEFSYSFPILSVSRIMALIFLLYAFKNRKKDFSFNKIITHSKEYYFLVAYFVLRIITNLRYLGIHGQSAKTIGLIILEQLFILIAFHMLSPSKEDMIQLLKYIVIAATILFAIGIFESITFIRPFDELNTVSRGMLNEHYLRLGLLRATTTMKMPGYYGNMCIIILPIIMYLYHIFKQKRYLVSAGLCVMAILHSGSRSDLIFLFAILLYSLLFVYKGKERISFIKTSSILLCSLVILICLLSFSNNKLKYFYTGSAKAVLNEIGFDFDLNQDTPEGVDGFGGNTYGSASRIEQFAGIYDTLSTHPLFGYGSGAEDRKDFKYYRFRNSSWYRHNSYDVGLVEIICDEGIIGLLAFLSLFIYIILSINHINEQLIRKYCYLLIFAYFISTFSTANMMHLLFLIIFIVSNQNRLENLT